MKKVVPLKNSVMLDHPVISLAHVRFQKHGRDIGMVGGAQRIANVVQKRTHHVLFIFPIFMGQRGGLQAVGQSVYGKASAITLKQHKMSLYPFAYVTPKLEKFGADDFPIFLRAIFHMMELGAFR